MRNVSVSDLKAHLSQYLHEVRRGGEVQVLDRGVPIARISGVSSSARGADDDHRQRLIRSGLVRASTKSMSEVLDQQPLNMPVDLWGAIEEERSDRL